jgi:hypothetical protein
MTTPIAFVEPENVQAVSALTFVRLLIRSKSSLCKIQNGHDMENSVINWIAGAKNATQWSTKLKGQTFISLRSGMTYGKNPEVHFTDKPYLSLSSA